MRFSFYNQDNWNDISWSDNGPRVLHYSWDAFGAVSLGRLDWPNNGVAVPNALFNGGYTSAIGATAGIRVNDAYSPSPTTLIYLISQGRNPAEAVLISSFWIGDVWEFVGDPLMSVPCWIGDEECLPDGRSKIDKEKGN